nr:hypothetical protein [Mycobacterium sp. E3198]
MARESEGPDRVMKRVCPLQCQRHPEGRASAAGQVDWAGLPVNLDLAFSQNQRDKVYVQHVMRRQGSQLWRWVHGDTQVCVCETAATDGAPSAEPAKDYVKP